ncbi:hypothetical protein M406DRAFT_249738 [Cryphonectria parasitica EP155]|uniref:Uncharacterized protein n=1 Tax=Cryphonectria parasitica (strain ATCC 38755 / EP155) TaxID=660469 RepID=A0A9P4Y8F8_CRYP1|nr:uncharacterized protein M406DRAFT_249738 [Cryphonectria parasitica EP155]KAF3768329.1 hypothetical protein M406DRAFT_249738 [Cryphonectria parasitica EP155]
MPCTACASRSLICKIMNNAKYYSQYIHYACSCNSCRVSISAYKYPFSFSFSLANIPPPFLSLAHHSRR